jgi:uncharacterized OB-fold protein
MHKSTMKCDMADSNTAPPRHLDRTHFIEGEHGWTLAAGRCGHCEAAAFPRPPVCPDCWSEDIRVVPLSKRGTLYSYTVIHPGKSRDAAPVALGYVDLVEGVRIFGYLAAATALRPDMAVQLTVATTEDARSLRFYFVPEEQVDAHG